MIQLWCMGRNVRGDWIKQWIRRYHGAIPIREDIDYMRRYEKFVPTTYHVWEDTILSAIFSAQYTYNCTIHPELRRATTNTCKQNNCANSHELCPPKKSIHVFEVGLETRGERQFTRLSPFPRRAVLVVHHSCTESKATTRNLVAAPEEPRSLKTPGKPE